LSGHISQSLAPEIVGKRWFPFGGQRAAKQPGRFQEPLAPVGLAADHAKDAGQHRQNTSNLPLVKSSGAP
jgi:hypothetical protein